MYRIIDDRGSGKTGRLMLLAKEMGAKLVCSNPPAMRSKAYSYGITGIDFVSYEDFICGFVGPEDKVLIDEIEVFANYFTGGKLVGYTLSNED